MKGDVLDLGCGIGEVAKYVETQDRYFGVDISPYCVEYLQSKRLWAKLGSAYEIPLDSESVDVVIMSHVLEHLDDPRKSHERIFPCAAAFRNVDCDCSHALWVHY